MDDNSWIPQGTHEVQIGPSLNKALKARKGGPPPQAKRTGPPEKDFYSFRYNRKPPSLDTTRPGTIEVSRGKDTTTVVVEHPSSQPGESHLYSGTVRTESSAKELDCVLIYDEETGFYKLEKLESYIGLNYDRKTLGSLPQSSASTPARIETDSETRLSQEIDADGEPDDELPSHFLQREEEEEDEEDLEPVAALPPPPPPPVVKPVKAPPAPKPAPAPAPPAASTSRPTKPVPQRKTTTKKAVPPPPPIGPLDGVHEEQLEFGFAAKRAKHAPPQPPAPAPAPAPAAVFSLPGSSSGWEEEDEWDEVPVAPPLDDLELELNLEAEMQDAYEDQDGDGSEQEDFLADVLPQAPDSTATSVKPILSLSQLGGLTDDEFSSSEDSDDD
ncbi:RNA polymerase II transcription elongation factor-domain-containing protein [Mycena galopus ATCC 62051]|nr:RNA polymerase II transcription elongation factor-domain-containing protein [Mycena galopus ATCC 62051]